jgi:hypothetical protein
MLLTNAAQPFCCNNYFCENRAQAEVAEHGQYQSACGPRFSGLAITSNGVVSKEVVEFVKIAAQH